jgi:hypothetical protein
MVAHIICHIAAELYLNGSGTPGGIDTAVVEPDVRGIQGKGKIQGILRRVDAQPDGHGHIRYTVFVDGDIELDAGGRIVSPGADSQPEHRAKAKGQSNDSALQANPSFTILFIISFYHV